MPWKQQVCYLSLPFFTNFESFVFKSCSLVVTALYWGFSLCSNMEKSHQETSSMESVFKSNW